MMSLPQVRQTFGLRLGQARRMKGLSLRGLSDRVGGRVTAAALNKYEHGVMLPGTNILGALCRELGQKADFFFRPPDLPLSRLEFRKRSGLGRKAETALIESAADHFERYREIENILGLDSRFKNPLGGMLVRGSVDIERAAGLLREKWKLGEDAIPSVVSLLEDKQILIYESATPAEFDGFAGWAGAVPVIALNAGRAPERKRLTALHELAHLLLDFGRMAPGCVEKLCHSFAAAVLFPAEVFRREFGGVRKHVSKLELVELKQRYGLSCSAIMMRAASLGLLSESALRSFHIRWRSLGYARNEPGSWALPEKADRFESLVSRAVANGDISMSKASYLLRKSLAEVEKSMLILP